MVQSIRAKYRNVVCLVPISKLDTAVLRAWLDKVMISIDEFLLVSAISLDNHVCNRWDKYSIVHWSLLYCHASDYRKLFLDLCGGEQIFPSIEHPVRRNERLFLLFDFTHNFKNIFNHFVNKKMMHIPSHGHNEVLESPCFANFQHVIKLYGLEESKPLKVAHSLKKVSLNPSSIARISPSHALSEYSAFCLSFQKNTLVVLFN